MTLDRKLTAADMDALDTEMKLAFIASKDPAGLPHIGLITSLQAKAPDRLMFGEFVRGRTKRYVQDRPEVAWAMVSLDKALWRGRARWTGLTTSGPDLDMYNSRPTFRYNAYFGIHTVHYLDLAESSPRANLPMTRIIPAALVTRLLRAGTRGDDEPRVMTAFSEDLFNQLDALKLLAWVDSEGWPHIIPLIQCQAANHRRLIFSTLAWGRELRKVPEGTTVAVFAANTAMENVLVRGALRFGRRLGVPFGAVDVDWVYNSMPPAHGQIYPPLPLEPVTRF